MTVRDMMYVAFRLPTTPRVYRDYAIRDGALWYKGAPVVRVDYARLVVMVSPALTDPARRELWRLNGNLHLLWLSQIPLTAAEEQNEAILAYNRRAFQSGLNDSLAQGVRAHVRVRTHLSMVSLYLERYQLFCRTFATPYVLAYDTAMRERFEAKCVSYALEGNNPLRWSALSWPALP